nr:hypothetical protein [Tanacetum cinerariifolium]
QDKYIAEILKKFGLIEGKSASTPIDTEKPLLKDPDGEDVDVHTYSDSPLLGVNTPKSDEDMLKLMELMVFLLPKVEKVGIEVHAVDLQVFDVNDVTRLQALADRKKVVVTEATIREALRFDDAEGVDCLPNEEIFTELARMGYEKPSTKLTFYKDFFSSQWKFLIHTILQCMSAKRTSWNEFSSSMASVVICLSSGDTSTHTTKYTSPALTQKVFANMKRVENRFSGVETPLFEGMLVEQEIDAEGDANEHVEEVNTGDATEGDDSAAHGEVPAKKNKVRVLKLRRLQKVRTSQRVKTSDDTVMDDESNQGRMIAEMDQDDVVVLKDDTEYKEVADAVKDVEKAKVDESAQDQGRQAESQDEIYMIDMDHANNVLSMQEDETEPAEVQEVVDVVTTAKLIIEVVTAASETITAASAIVTTAEAQVPAATTATLTAAPVRVAAAPSRRKKGVVIRDPKEASTTSTIIPAETKSKDKGKGILVEEPKPLKKKQQIEQDEQYARELHAELNKDIDWDEAIDHVKTKEQIEEDENRALQTINETPAERASKRRKLDEDVEDLKRHLQIMPNEDDDVYTEATPLAKKVPVVDYEIIEMNNKPYYKIIRADGTHQLYITRCTCSNLEELKKCTWSSKCQELEATGIMWCADHNFYNHTTDFVSRKEMLNAVRLQVEEESEASLEFLRFTRQQHQEGHLE